MPHVGKTEMAMKKSLLCVVLIILSALLLVSCGTVKTEEDGTKPSVTTAREGFEDVTAPPETGGDTSGSDSNDSNTVSSHAVFGTAEAVNAAREWLGDSDPDTGYKYSYSFDEMLTDNGKEYFKVRVSWYIEEEDRYSLCGYLLVSEGGGSIQKYDW